MNSQILAAYMAAKKKEEEEEEEKKKNRHATISQEAHNNLAKKQQPQQQTTTDVFVDAGDKPQDTGDTKLTAESDKPSRLDQANKAFQKQLQLEGDVLLTTGKKVAKDFASSVTNLDTINRTVNPIKNISNINTDDLIRYANGDRDVWAQLSFSRLKSSQEARQVPFLGQIVTELAEGKYKGDAEALKDAIQRGRSSLSIQNYNKYVAPLDESISKEVSNLANQYGADKGFENFVTSAGAKGLEFAGMGGLGYTPVATGVIAGSAHDTTANNFRLTQGETVSDLGRDALVNIIEGGIFGKLVGNATGSLNSGISPELKGAARYLKAGWNGFKTFAGISLATQSLDFLKSNPNFDFINWDHVEEGYKSGEYKTLQDYLNSYQFEQDVMWSRATQTAFAGLMGAISNMLRVGQNKAIGEKRLITMDEADANRQDALKVLGLKEGATEKEIQAAWKNMSKLQHPDVGGTNDMQAAINNARDILLGKNLGTTINPSTQTPTGTDIVPTTEAPSAQTYTAPSSSNVVVPPTAIQMQTTPAQAPVTYKDPEEVIDVRKLIEHWVSEANKNNKPYIDNMREKLKTGQGATAVIDELAEENGVSPTEIYKDLGINVPYIDINTKVGENKTNIGGANDGKQNLDGGTEEAGAATNNDGNSNGGMQEQGGGEGTFGGDNLVPGEEAPNNGQESNVDDKRTRAEIERLIKWYKKLPSSDNATKKMFSQKSIEILENVKENWSTKGLTPEIGFSRVIDGLGTTEDFNYAGFIFPGGQKIDLSGKKLGLKSDGKVRLNHDMVLPFSGYERDDIIKNGAIRIDPEYGIVEFTDAVPITDAQWNEIEKYINYIKKNNKSKILTTGNYFLVEVLKKDGTRESFQISRKMDTLLIIDALQEYLRTGKMPEEYNGYISEPEEKIKNSEQGSFSMPKNLPEELPAEKRRFLKEFKQVGYININGVKINSVEDLADVCQVFRDPIAETLRVMYKKNGIVVGQGDYTTHSARRVGINGYALARLIKIKAPAFGADEVDIMHNHPDSSVVASDGDKGFTKDLAENLQGSKIRFGHHIIIDHNEFSEVFADGSVKEHIKLREPTYNEIEKDFSKEGWTNIKANTNEKIAALASYVKNGKNLSTVLWVTNHNDVQLMQSLSNDFFNNSRSKVVKYIKDNALKMGATKAYYATTDPALFDKILKLRLSSSAIVLYEPQKDGSIKVLKARRVGNHMLFADKKSGAMDEALPEMEQLNGPKTSLEEIKKQFAPEKPKGLRKKEPTQPKKKEAKAEGNASKEEKKKALKDKLRELATRLQEKYSNVEGLSKEEAEQYIKLNKEMSDIRYDLEKNYYQDISEKNIKDERLTSLDKNIYVQARKDLLSNKDIYDAIEEASFGVFFNSDTPVDDIMEGKNKKVTAEELYNAFNKTRELLRKQYGDTITLYRVEGLQKSKATKNYGSSLAYTKQYGSKVSPYNINVKDIIAINTNRNGTYEDIIVASNGIDNYLNKETKSETKKEPPKRLEPPKKLGFDAVDKEKEALEQAANKLRDELAKQKKDYEKKLAKKDEEIKGLKSKTKEQNLKRKVRLEAKKKKDSEEKRFKSATPKGKLRMLGRKIEKQTGYYEVNNFPELDEVYEREFGKTIRQTIETLYNRKVFPYLPAKMQDVVNTFRDETYLKANWKTFDKYLREALEIDELKKLIDETDAPVAKKLLERIKIHNAAPITIKNAREMYEDLLLLQDIVDFAEEKMSYKRVNEDIDKTLTKASDELETVKKIRTPKDYTDMSAKFGKASDFKAMLTSLPQYLSTRIQMLMGGNPDSSLKIIWDWFKEGNEKEMELDVAFARNFDSFAEKAPGGGWRYVKDLEKDFSKDAKPIDTGITGSAPNGKKYGENAKLTKDIIMHIVASSRNQDNLMSFSKVLLGEDFEGNPVYSKPGGYVVPNKYWLDRGNLEKAYIEGKKYVFTMGEINHLESLLTDTEKKFVDAALNVGKLTAKYGNEVSQKLVGRDIFTVDNYIRIIRDPNTIDQELIDPAKLENLANAMSKDFVGIEGILGRGGSLEARNHRSTRPIYGESLLQSVTNSFKGTKKYIAYALPLYDTDMLLKSRLPDKFKKVATVDKKPRSTNELTYQGVDELPRNGASHTRYYIDNGNSYDIYEVEEKGKSLRELINDTGDKGFDQYYNQFVDNLLGRGKKYSKLSSLRAKVVLNANLRVAATQFFSYFQIGQFLEHPARSMFKGLIDKRSIYSLAKDYLESKGEEVADLKDRDVINKVWEEVTFLNTFRGLGYSSADVSYIEAGSTVLGRVNNGALMKAVDRFTVDATFRTLAEDLMSRGFEFGTPEFFNAFKQELYAVYQSNPQYAKIYKTPLQTMPYGLGTALSQFNTVMIEGYNNVMQARMAEDYYKKIGDKTNRKKASKWFRNALLGLATGGILLVMMRDAVDRVMGKDKDDPYVQRIFGEFVKNMLSYTIVGDEIFAAIMKKDNYDLTTNELSYAQNVLDTLGYFGAALTGGKPSDMIKAVKGALQTVGVPSNGIENIFSMIGNATNLKAFKAYQVLKDSKKYEQYLKNEDLIDGDIATFYDMKKVMTEKVLTEDYEYIKGSKAKTYNSKGSAKARAIRDVLGFPKDGALTEEQSKEYNKWYEVFKNS